MKILAISDIPSQGLEHTVEKHPKKLKDIELIISCGDLDRGYVEFIADVLNKRLFFVRGNHDIGCEEAEGYEEKEKKCFIAGTEDLHGRVEQYKNYLIVGFGGSKWYGGKGFEFREKEMATIVNSVRKKIRWIKLADRIARRGVKEIIVVSHAPLLGIHDQKDPCHVGFKCFHDFLKRTSPLLWIHGHVHLPDLHRNQVTRIEHTTVINAFYYKYINIEKSQIHVSYRADILDT